MGKREEKHGIPDYDSRAVIPGTYAVGPTKCDAFAHDPTPRESKHDGFVYGNGRRLDCELDAHTSGDHVSGGFAWHFEGSVPFSRSVSTTS